MTLKILHSHCEKTYSGSPLDVATTTNQLNVKAKNILSLINQKGESSTRARLIEEDFHGFKPVAYQDSIISTSVQVIRANEHYDRVITFDITPLDYYSPDASLVMYMQMVKGDDANTATNLTQVIPVEKFWGRYFTSIKVKRQGDVNVININSDDLMTQFNLFIESMEREFVEWDIDLLTTNRRYGAIDKSIRENNPTGVATTNASIDKRMELSAAKLVKSNARFVIPLRALCNFFEIKGPLPPECTLTIELAINQNRGEIFDLKLKNANVSPTSAAAIKLVKPPEILLPLVEQSSTHRMSFEQIFNTMQSYRIWNGFSWETRSKELAKRVSEAEITSPPNMFQYR